MLYVSISEDCESAVTNIIIERLIARDSGFASGDAGKRIHLTFYLLHLRNRNH